MMIKIISPYDVIKRTGTIFPDQGRTEQNHKKACDINLIMKRFEQTGNISHAAKYSPTYGDILPDDLMSAIQTVETAETMFSELPAKLRKRFEHKPEKFLEYVQDPNNFNEMKELGLVVKETKQATLQDVVNSIESMKTEQSSEKNDNTTQENKAEKP